MFRILFLLSCVGGIGFVYWTHQQMPESVAIHFGAGGVADSWASNGQSLQMSVTAFLFMTGLFLAIPLLVRLFPTRWINFPDKEYWFSDERRDATVKKVQPWFDCLGLFSNSFFVFTYYLVYQANQVTPAALDNRGMIYALGVYGVLMIGWLLVFFKTFKRAKK